MKRIVAVGRVEAGRYIVQVPAAILYAGRTLDAWADCPPVEGHARLRDAAAQAETVTGCWRIVYAQDRNVLVVTEREEN